MQTMSDPFSLEIYPDPSTNEASGILYIDDGETFNHQHSKEYNLIEFKYISDGSLEVIPVHIGYVTAKPFILDSINIYNQVSVPKRVLVKDDEGEYAEISIQSE